MRRVAIERHARGGLRRWVRDMVRARLRVRVRVRVRVRTCGDGVAQCGDGARVGGLRL